MKEKIIWFLKNRKGFELAKKWLVAAILLIIFILILGLVIFKMWSKLKLLLMP